MDNQLGNIERAIGRLEGKIDSLCGTMKDLQVRVNDNEDEIAKNKGAMKIVGAIGVFVGGVITAITSWVLNKY